MPGSLSFFQMHQMAQTFTPRLTGRLDHIALWQGSSNFNTPSFQLQVWTVDTSKSALTAVEANPPTYQLTGTRNRSQQGWDLVPSVPVVAGRQYALVVTAPFPLIFRWYYMSNWGYAGGDLWVGSPLSKDTARDFTFEIYLAGATTPPPANTPPTLNPLTSSAVTVPEGTQPSVSGIYSDPDPGDTVALTASTGNLARTGTNQGTWTWTGTASDEGPAQTVTISADDHHNPSVSTSFTVQSVAVAPTATITPAGASGPQLAAATALKEGTPVSFGGSAHSPSADDNTTGFSYTWSVTKDGAPYAAAGTGATFGFTPDDEGAYIVTLTAADDGPARGTTTLSFNVVDVLPTATITAVTPALTSPKIILPNELVTFTGTFTDPGTADPHTATWRFGDGQSAAGWSVTHYYTSAGVYTVSLDVAQGEDPGVGTATTTVTVLTPAQALGRIAEAVNNLPGLNAGQKNSLIAKLNAAADSAARGDAKTATNQLNAFLNELRADTNTGKVSSTDADDLGADVQAVKGALGGYNRFLDLWPLGI